jgi:hypothetical protein
LVGCAVALGAVVLRSLRIGSIDVTTRSVVDALFSYTPSSYEQTVVRTLRLPRTLIGLVVGAALAVAGAAQRRSPGGGRDRPHLAGAPDVRGAARRRGRRDAREYAGTVCIGRTLHDAGCGQHWGQREHESPEYLLEDLTRTTGA